MIDQEYIIVTACPKDDHESALFTSREVAIDWFKKLQAKNIPVTIQVVELDSAKDLILQFDL